MQKAFNKEAIKIGGGKALLSATNGATGGLILTTAELLKTTIAAGSIAGSLGATIGAATVYFIGAGIVSLRKKRSKKNRFYKALERTPKEEPKNENVSLFNRYKKRVLLATLGGAIGGSALALTGFSGVPFLMGCFNGAFIAAVGSSSIFFAGETISAVRREIKPKYNFLKKTNKPAKKTTAHKRFPVVSYIATTIAISALLISTNHLRKEFTKATKKTEPTKIGLNQNSIPTLETAYTIIRT